MPVSTKTNRCPSCGTKNDPDSSRCRVCTRTLPHIGLPSEAAYEQALYANPVRGSAGRPRRRPLIPMLALVVVALVAWNYVSLGYGPSWAHRAQAHRPGQNWRTFRGVPGVTVQLPGEPVVETVDTRAGFLTRAQVGIDGDWDAVLDASTTSPAAKRDGRQRLAATLVVASTTPIADPDEAIPTLLGALLDGVTISEISLNANSADAVTASYDVVASYRGFPTAADRGALRAKVIVGSDTTTIATTFSCTSGAVLVQDRLLAGLTPGGER